MLSKILTASALAGSFGSRTKSAKSQIRVLELDAERAASALSFASVTWVA
jgi:hypothetical protein